MKLFVLALVCGLGWAPAVAQPLVLPMPETPGPITRPTDFASGALYLAKLLADPTLDRSEPKGQLSLILHIGARKVAGDVEYFALSEQEFDLWDYRLIESAGRLLAEADAQGFQPWWAQRAEVLALQGDRAGQAEALRRAMGLTGDAALRDWLAARLAQASQRS